MKLVRTDSTDFQFLKLVSLLDADLAERDGDDHEFYHQFNAVEALQHCVVVYEDEMPVSCGAMKAFESHAFEIKRMYTLPSRRGKGYAGIVLSELEQWAHELGRRQCVLETGKRQPEAIGLYTSKGYQPTPNYGPYTGVENSLCFSKILGDGA